MDNQTIEYICGILRRGSTTWKGRVECLNRHRRQRQVGFKVGGEPKYLWEHPCEICWKWFDQKDNLLQVDHIDEVGPYKGDLHKFAGRIYCDTSNLQCLCMECHARKTSLYNASLRFERKVSRKRERLDAF